MCASLWLIIEKFGSMKRKSKTPNSPEQNIHSRETLCPFKNFLELSHYWPKQIDFFNVLTDHYKISTNIDRSCLFVDWSRRQTLLCSVVHCIDCSLKVSTLKCEWPCWLSLDHKIHWRFVLSDQIVLWATKCLLYFYLSPENLLPWERFSART